jgi:AraC-like DNA-binding protein
MLSAGSSTAPNDGLFAKHEIVRTDSLERMNEALLTACKGRIVSADCRERPFFGQANRVQLEHIGFDYCAYDAEVEIDFPGVLPIRQLICLKSKGETIMRRKSAPLSDVATCVIQSGESLTGRYGAGYRQIVFRVDPTALRCKLEAFVGTTLPRPIEFHPAQTLLTPQAEMFKRSAFFFASEIESFDNEACRLARDEFEQAMLAAFLAGNAHNYSYLLDAPPPGLTPRQVWLAESFIEANWDQPLTIDSLAAVVGVGARSIFKAFKDYRGYSPMAFLKDVRLQRAREMLVLAKPGDSVTAIAYRCGFQNHGHFARAYRGRFGESPSTTLAGTRRARLF